MSPTSRPAAPASAALRLLADVHPLSGLPAAALQALEAHLRIVAVPAGRPVRAACDGADGVGFVVEGGVEWVPGSPGRATPPARTAGPHRAFVFQRMDEEGPHPRVVRGVLESRVAWIPLEAVRGLAAEHPDLAALLERLGRREALACMHLVLGTLDDPLLDELETAADWRSLRRGEVLFDEGTPSDGLHFVVSGRLKALHVVEDGRDQVLGSIGPGEPAGEVAFFTGGVRGARVQAARTSLVVQLSDAEFDALASRRPQLARAVARSVVQRVQSQQPTHLATATLVVVSAHGRPRGPLVRELAAALGRFGAVLHLDRAAADARTGGYAAAPDGTRDGDRADAWLEAAEAGHRYLLLEADPTPTEWTLRCLRQADRVVVLADAAEGREPGPVELLLHPERGVTEAPTALVLLHPEETVLPAGTRHWLSVRPWVTSHHHIRRGDAAGVPRVARALAGRSVAVVLGGGGTRGFAHIGIVRAMMEAGVPVDQVGGTSMGAFMASHFAMGWDWERVVEVNRHVYFHFMPQRGFTLPIISLVGTSRPEASGVWVYGDAEIEDLWIPFFCVSADLTTSDMRVHRGGLVRRATLASAALPGFAAPALEDGHLLVDGGLVNNLPVDVARGGGAATIFASEVTVETDDNFTCERIPSPWEVIRGRFNGRPPRFPSMMEVAMRAALLTSTSRQQSSLEEADFVFRPPIEIYGMLDFDRLDAIVETGYEHGRSALELWREEGRLDALVARSETAQPPSTAVLE